MGLCTIPKPQAFVRCGGSGPKKPLNLSFTKIPEVEVLFWEQKLKYRKSLGPLRNGAGRFDVARILKSLLIRRDLFWHLRATFPKLDGPLSVFGSVGWYKQQVG